MAIIDSIYSRVLGTIRADSLTSSVDYQILFGLQGSDALRSSGLVSWLVGGSGADQYRIDMSGVTTIQDAGSSANDIVIDSSGLLTDASTVYATIESRHLVAVTPSGEGILLMDWATPQNKIESFYSNGTFYSFDDFANYVVHAPGWSQDFSFVDIGFTAAEANTLRAAINEVGPLSVSLEQAAIAALPPLPPDIDFNGDGKSDLLWRHDSGMAAVWLQDGFSIASSGTFASVDASWTIGDTGDFNGDGKSDIVWRQSSGAVAMWLMNGSTIAGGTTFSSVDSSWHLRDTGDFNGDSRSDLLWEQDGGALALWQMNGFNVSGTALTLSGSQTAYSLASGWTILRTGDFDGDHNADILARNTSTGAAQIWLMNGATIGSQETVSSVDNSWKVADVADFNGDGKADIVWRQQTGAVAMWLMDGASVSGGTTFSNVDASWTLADAADYTGDGKADLVWRQDSGAVAMWQMDGFTIAAGTTFFSIDGSWHLQPTNDIFS